MLELIKNPYLYEAADIGLADALYRQAISFIDDEDKSIETIIGWLRSAAEQEHTDAQYFLGQIYHQGEKVKQDIVLAIEWYTRSAENGNPLAQHNLAHLLLDHDIEEEEKAIYWLRKASELNFIPAQIDLAYFLLNDFDELEYKIKEALYWYYKAAQSDSPDALYALANLYLTGQHLSKNIAIAALHYEEAAKLGHKLSIYNLAILNLNGGEKFPKNMKKGLSLLLEAANLEIPQAQHRIAKHLLASKEECDQADGFVFLQKASDNGYVQSMYELAILFFDGNNALEPNEKMAFYWMKKAAENNLVSAIHMLGVFYYSGIGTEKNNELAALYYEKAAEFNLPDAQYNYAKLLYNNSDSLIDAYKWSRLAFINGYDGGDQLSISIKKLLSPDQLLSAEGLVSDFLKKDSEEIPF